MKTNKLLNRLLGTIVVAIMAVGCSSSRKSEPTAENETLKTIFSRKSVRSYTSQQVSGEMVTTLLKAAMAAPTAVNKQPWAFIVIDQRSILDSLAVMLPYAKMLKEASVAVVVCGDTDKALLDTEQAYWVQDCSAATENLLLAAESMGLGAVWTGVFPREDRVLAVRNVLSLPENIVPLNVIPIGYPKNPNESPKDKFKMDNIHYNGF